MRERNHIPRTSGTSRRGVNKRQIRRQYRYTGQIEGSVAARKKAPSSFATHIMFKTPQGYVRVPRDAARFAPKE